MPAMPAPTTATFRSDRLVSEVEAEVRGFFVMSFYFFLKVKI